MVYMAFGKFVSLFDTFNLPVRQYLLVVFSLFARPTSPDWRKDASVGKSPYAQCIRDLSVYNLLAHAQ